MTDVHVVPVADPREHDDTEACWCAPTVEVQENGNRVIIHNAADARELIEEHGVN